MKQYTPKQINEIKQQIRTGKPLPIIADDLAKEWERPVSGVYSKVFTLSKNTRKINNTWKGPARREYKKRLRPTMATQLPPDVLSSDKRPTVREAILG